MEYELIISLVNPATLKQDTENAKKWFIINVMQVNPPKFQCMFLKPLTNKE